MGEVDRVRRWVYSRNPIQTPRWQHLTRAEKLVACTPIQTPNLQQLIARTPIQIPRWVLQLKSKRLVNLIQVLLMQCLNRSHAINIFLQALPTRCSNPSASNEPTCFGCC